MTLDEIISRVAREQNIPIRIVDRTYRAYWKAIREYVCSLPLKEDLSDEEFLKLQPNINIPSIGKLHITLDRYRNMKKMYKIKTEQINAAHKEN